jgi:hypothetical protein
MKISELKHEKLKGTLAALQQDRYPWWGAWGTLADYYMPKRYVWLLAKGERSRYLAINGKIVDPTGTKAARVLASGMMNGITSPSRPWFRLRLAGFEDDADYGARAWLDEVERRMLLIMAESNFYNCLAILYIDLIVFGTGAMLIYDDYDHVICCYNHALGEYYLAQDDKMRVNTFAREFCMKLHQVAQWFGEENLSETRRAQLRLGGAALQQDVDLVHIVEPNVDYSEDKGGVPARFKFREYYWDTGAPQGEVLRRAGYFEIPGIFPRWEITGNDAYGTSVAMDALGDVIQLQHETIRKGQSLDYMNRPPMLLDIQLQHRPTALLPGGQTFIAGLNAGSVGGKPAYQITPPIQELTLDIREIQARIRETFHNDLFRMISELDTVRSATEIDARREEKLVQLGPVLERFENEALDPAIRRIFNIMVRAQLIPPAPESITQSGASIEVQYVSILAAAQSAVGVIPTERFMQVVGNVSAIYPQALNIPNWDELLRGYARDIGVKAQGVNPVEVTEQLNQAQQQTEQMQGMAEQALPAAQAAELLSRTDVGGGQNALAQILGGGQ